MPRIALFTAAWLAAAAVALGVAWSGVAIVGDRVTAQRPAPLSASDIRARAQDPTDPTTTSSASSAADATTTTTVAARATTTSRPSSSATTTATTTASSPSTTASPAAETRTYNAVGGSASLRFTPTGVTVQWANPNAGFEVKVESEHGNGVRVEFESDDHRTRVEGWWADGPQDQVLEEER